MENLSSKNPVSVMNKQQGKKRFREICRLNKHSKTYQPITVYRTYLDLDFRILVKIAMTFGYLNIYRIFDGILALLLNFFMFDNIMVMF